MRINNNGDAQGNYTLLSLQKISPVMDKANPNYYPLEYGLTITADFIHDFSENLPIVRFKREMHWQNGHPPLDEPICGFLNEYCQAES